MMEEISLRELIEALLKNKRIIAIITILSIALSAIVSYLILEPVYEAKTVLMAQTLAVSSLLNSR